MVRSVEGGAKVSQHPVETCGEVYTIERVLELKPIIQELGSINWDLQLSSINLQDFIHVI